MLDFVINRVVRPGERMLLRKSNAWAGSVRWIVLFCLPVASVPALAQSPGVYDIDPENSEIHWRIYKAGAFARFGHNHVIAIGQPSGTVEVAGNPADSRVTIEFA